MQTTRIHCAHTRLLLRSFADFTIMPIGTEGGKGLSVPERGDKVVVTKIWRSGSQSDASVRAQAKVPLSAV